MKTRKPFACLLTTAALLGLPALAARAQQTIYDDQLAGGWGNYSWAGNALDNGEPVHGGKHSIRVSVAANSYGALELRAGDPLPAPQYQALMFWINGGPVGGQSSLVVKASVGGKQQGMVAVPALKAKTWQQVTVPLSALGVADSTGLTGFLIQNNSTAALPDFYVDDVQLTLAPAAPPADGPARPLAYTGVNLSGGEFGGTKSPLYGRSFTYPTPAEMGYFAGKGLNVIRLPFHWEVLQPELNKPLDTAEFARFKGVVDAATAKGLTVILDPHNYARYGDKTVGTADVPDAAFADFWGRLAGQFAGNARVWFGLMNEPHDMPTAQWLGSANAAIADIRKAGAKNLILVPGNNWTGAHSWVGADAGANGVAMLGVKDPANRFIYEVHQYLDPASAGDKPDVVSPTIGVERLEKFTAWCRQHHQRGFLGEFGADAGPLAAAAVGNTLAFMEKNRDVWVGFTWWSAGPWWGDYMFTLEPKDGQDRPQMAFLRPHFQIAPVRAPKTAKARP